MSKIVLNENQYNTLIESLWDNVKHGLTKFGTGVSSNVSNDTKLKIQFIIDKKGNELIKSLDDYIKKTNPEFPNNKDGKKFLSTIIYIAAVYDSVVDATRIDKN